MSYYDETFEPWEIVDGKCVVADEAEWKKIDHVVDGYFEKSYLHNPGGAKIGEHPKRPVVKIATDVFDDRVKRPVVSTGGVHCFDLAGESESVCGLLNRLLQTIDATPHVDYLIPTLFPERVRKSWAPYMPQGWWDAGSDTNSKFREDEPKIRKRLEEAIGLKLPDARYYTRKNVTLSTYVETQDDIERLVPELLKCHDLCKGLAVVCNPKEELHVDILSTGVGVQFIDPLNGKHYNGPGSCVDCAKIDLIIAEGNEHPIHPDWLRLLRDQCLDAGVRFHFAGWGDWVPIGDFGKANSWTRTQIDPVLKGSINGEFAGEYETLYPWPETCNNPCLIRCKDKSGRLLDGQEHNGVPGGEA